MVTYCKLDSENNGEICWTKSTYNDFHSRKCIYIATHRQFVEASKSLNAKTPVLRDTPIDLPSSAFLPCLYNSNGITNITCTWLQKDMFMSFYTDTEMEDCGLIDITDKCIHINIFPISPKPCTSGAHTYELKKKWMPFIGPRQMMNLS